MCPAPGKVSSPIRDRRKGQELQRTYLVVCKKKGSPSKVTPGRSRGARPAPTTVTDSLTPRFRAVLGQPGHGACGQLANRIAPQFANQPIASRRPSNFEWQLHASHSALSNEAPNSNQRRLTLATSARGGAARREPGTRGAIAQERGRRSSSGSGPSPASLGRHHGEW